MSSTNTDIDLTKLTKFYSDKIEKQYGTIRHLESEISKKDERIAELEADIKTRDERIQNLELHIGKQNIEKKPSEPFIFTKDTPVRIENGEVELFFHDCDTVYGKRKDLSQNEWEFHQWNKYGHSKSLVSRYNLIPILPEKRVVDVWVCVSDKDREFYAFENESEAKDFVRVNVEYYIEHHTIELKGKSNV